ncbi:hypothetical protein Mpsy_2984 [Methanolobus psychrophilus R15]|nr:hypothetical protein Mpsy_2984 [Methanolobus psychrophilus R15]
MLIEITIPLNKWMKCKYCRLFTIPIVIEKHGFNKKNPTFNIKVGLS